MMNSDVSAPTRIDRSKANPKMRSAKTVKSGEEMRNSKRTKKTVVEKQQQNAVVDSVDPTAKSCICDLCNLAFSSKTKLFKHLESHGFEGNNTKPLKIVLLVGWLNDLMLDDDTWAVDQTGSASANYTDQSVEVMEHSLWLAIYAIDNNLQSVSDVPIDLKLERPKGFSRGSSCMQRSSLLLETEPSCHGCVDTFCFQAKRWLGGNDNEWVAKVNGFLPTHIQVLHRITLSAAAAGELHAENNCSQRRYEYMMPLRLVMPPELIELPSEPIVRRVRTKKVEEVEAMDKEFPLDTEEGQARVHYFRNLKKLLKLFAGRKSYHNFASGGACPEESTAVRRVDRFYHKELITIAGESWVVFSISGDALLKGQARRMIGLAIGIMRGWLPESYLDVALSKSLIAEVPAVPGWALYIAECRYAFWEAKFVDEKLDPRRVDGAEVSRLDQWNQVVKEHIASLHHKTGDQWLHKFETDCKTMTSRFYALNQLQTRTKAALRDEFQSTFHQRFYGTRHKSALAIDEGVETAETSPTDTNQGIVESATEVGEGGQEVTEGLVEGAVAEEAVGEENEEVEEEEEHAEHEEYCYCPTYNQVNLQSAHSGSLSNEAKELFGVVLRLLHETESSGLWPLSSTGRQKVIADKTLVEKGGYGGSFSVGCLPKHLAQPKGNAQFPELMRACFRLEVALCPGRPPSSTIAINRHAQFRPHRDSGAGSGQSTSLIVALGDFTGGEVVVESVAHDIRYRPLEFDGWSQRHWTLPFVGERYSLVWFTPLGITAEDMFWWKDGQIV